MFEKLWVNENVAPKAPFFFLDHWPRIKRFPPHHIKNHQKNLKAVPGLHHGHRWVVPSRTKSRQVVPRTSGRNKPCFFVYVPKFGAPGQ